jgi:hypothetical protein
MPPITSIFMHAKTFRHKYLQTHTYNIAFIKYNNGSEQNNDHWNPQISNNIKGKKKRGREWVRRGGKTEARQTERGRKTNLQKQGLQLSALQKS